MITLFRQLYRAFSEHPKRNIAIFGLDAAGKTSLLNHLRVQQGLRPYSDIVPTIGQNVLKFDHRKIDYTIWDLGGQLNFRASWNAYHADSDALIFVIDSHAHDRFEEALDEMEVLAQSPETQGIPFAVCLNKRDIATSPTVNDFFSRERLNTLFGSRPWQLFDTVFASGSHAQPPTPSDDTPPSSYSTEPCGVQDLTAWVFSVMTSPAVRDRAVQRQAATSQSH
jgi:small GTP-binding protein